MSLNYQSSVCVVKYQSTLVLSVLSTNDTPFPSIWSCSKKTATSVLSVVSCPRCIVVFYWSLFRCYSMSTGKKWHVSMDNSTLLFRIEGYKKIKAVRSIEISVKYLRVDTPWYPSSLTFNRCLISEGNKLFLIYLLWWTIIISCFPGVTTHFGCIF
jgi:hypothetical protein